MNVIQLPAGTGKSVIAIRQAMNKKCPLVVPSISHKNKLLKLLEHLVSCNECSILQKHSDKITTKIYTLEEFDKILSEGKFKDSEVVFDDYDEIMRIKTGLDPNRITITTS